MSKKPNTELLEDENPEWTAEDFAKARPASEVLPQIFGEKVAKELLKLVVARVSSFRKNASTFGCRMKSLNISSLLEKAGKLASMLPYGNSSRSIQPPNNWQH